MQIIKTSPIILFAYNRPDHTKKTLDALALNDLARESDLFVFVDGAKAGSENTNAEVVALARSETRFRSTTVYHSSKNKGLAKSVVSGVSEILDRYDRAIILEDDLITSAGFLRFMNESLEKYSSFPEVACITGYIYPVREILPETFFLKGADCWGWGTWKRAWKELDLNGVGLLQHLQEKNLTQEFDFNDTFPYTRMLMDQINGKNNSWAILWYASAFIKDRLTLYPGRSMVYNIGIDGSGTHSGSKNYWHIEKLLNELHPGNIPLEENAEAKKIVGRYFQEIRGKSIRKKIKGAFTSLLRRFLQ